MTFLMSFGASDKPTTHIHLKSHITKLLTSPLCFGGANMSTENKPVRSRTSEMKIGRTTYIVTTTFNEKASETIGQMLVRYVADRISSDVNNSNLMLTAAKK